MKVGDYIRTKRGLICRIININEFREPCMKYGIETSYLKDIMFIGDEGVLKSSPNIIDLIEVGDYVVHYDHGIGKYLGMKTMEHSGIKRDFLFVMYGKGSNLYIPLEQLSSIMKYASKDVEGILLHEIGGTAWARTKAKVRSKVKDISEQLIKIYAARQNAAGFEFGPDTEEQVMFENEFEYELTLDQIRLYVLENVTSSNLGVLLPSFLHAVRKDTNTTTINKNNFFKVFIFNLYFLSIQ